MLGNLAHSRQDLSPRVMVGVRMVDIGRAKIYESMNIHERE